MSSVVYTEFISLTSETDQAAGTAGENTQFKAVAGNGDDATLNPDDTINGGADGTNELLVDMKSNFNRGFSSENALQNIDEIALTNETNSARSFNATNINGVDTWSISGAKGVNITDLAYVPETLQYSGLTGTNSVNFARGVATAGDDAVKLVLNEVGTVDAKGKPTYAKVNMDSVEEITVASNGDSTNYIDLSTIKSATSIAVEGNAAIEINNVSANVDSFSATAATGDVTADLTKAQTLTGLDMGKGNDTITVGSNGFEGNSPEIDGGAGDEDTLIFKVSDVSNIPTVPTMTGVETLVFDSTVANQIGFDLTNVDGLQEIGLKSQAKVAVINMEDMDELTVSDYGTGASTSIALNDGDYTLNYEANAAVQSTVTSLTEGVVNISTVGSNTLADSAKFSVDQASEVNIDVKTADPATITLISDSAETLTVNAKSDFTLQGDASASSAQAFPTALADGGVTSVDADSVQFLGSVTDIKLTGSGCLTVTGFIGSDETLDSTITIDASTSGGWKQDSSAIIAENIDFTGSAKSDNFVGALLGDGNDITMGAGADNLYLFTGQTVNASDYSISTVDLGDDFDQDIVNISVDNDSAAKGALISIENFNANFSNDKLLAYGTGNYATAAVVTGVDTAANAANIEASLALFGLEDVTVTTDATLGTNGVFFGDNGNAYIFFEKSSGNTNLGSALASTAGYTLVELVGVTATEIDNTNLTA